MADTVKKNGRNRRPPSHLIDGYNEDNFEPRNNLNLGNRVTEFITKDQSRNSTQTLTLGAMSKLLSKFINSVNKSYHGSYSETQVKVKKQREQQMANSSKRQTVSQFKVPAKTDKGVKEERQLNTTRPRETEETRQNANRQEMIKERYQQKNFKKIANTSISSAVAQSKKIKAQISSSQATIKNNLPSPDLFNIQSMAKMSKEQLYKMLPRGTDPNLFKQQLIQSSTLDRNSGKPAPFERFGSFRTNDFRQDTKLFKRASFHIGIAYNIHIETIKQKNPHFTQQQIDPTYVSRKMKQDNLEAQRRDERMRQDLLLRQMQRQQELANQQRAKQKKAKIQNQQTQNKQVKPSAQKKQPICIDIEDESEEKREKRGDPSQQLNQMGQQKSHQSQEAQLSLQHEPNQMQAQPIKAEEQVVRGQPGSEQVKEQSREGKQVSSIHKK